MQQLSKLQKTNHRSSLVVKRIIDPMAYINNILLGRITKSSGYEGAVAVKLEKNFTENIPQMESVFLEVEGRPVPFFISGLDYSGADVLKISFEGYTTSEKINEFIGCRIFLTNDSLDDNIQSADNQTLIDFAVYTQDGSLIGPVSDIISNNGQWLLNIISSDRKSILIPFHEDFIISIDKRKKKVVMDIPDGLLEIN
jgi:16S rRNA processing protein RimM